jgi:hypothetical protein
MELGLPTPASHPPPGMHPYNMGHVAMWLTLPQKCLCNDKKSNFNEIVLFILKNARESVWQTHFGQQ